jgi:hypothetical protein
VNGGGESGAIPHFGQLFIEQQGMLLSGSHCFFLPLREAGDEDIQVGQMPLCVSYERGELLPALLCSRSERSLLEAF